MLLGFKARFTPMVEDGSKTHTIRAKLKSGTRHAGETCHCYTGLRTKGARLLGRWPCVKVQDIKIYECADGRFSVWIGDEELTPDEKDALAWRDGFRNNTQVGAFVSMMRYWTTEHGDGREIQVSYVNFPQGEPYFPKGVRARRRKFKTLDFEGDIIHWRYTSPSDSAGRRRLADGVPPLASSTEDGSDPSSSQGDNS